MKYLDELVKSMNYLAANPKVIFLGQAISYPGNAIFKTLGDVPMEQRLELPVLEEVQLGISIGMALEGLVPVSVYPRFNFLILALNQLVNHLDKIPHISKGGFKPKVIIKTCVGSIRPLHPGVQHCSNFTEALRHMVDTIEVVELVEPEQIFPAYKKALEREDGLSTVLVEFGDLYGDGK